MAEEKPGEAAASLTTEQIRMVVDVVFDMAEDRWSGRPIVLSGIRKERQEAITNLAMIEAEIKRRGG